MHIVEFTADSLRFVDDFPEQAPQDGFVWVYLERAEFERRLPALQAAAQRLGGSAMLELHAQDVGSAAHPSNYDYTSVYDLLIFRRLATPAETRSDAEHDAAVSAYHGQGGRRGDAAGELAAFERISSRAVAFVVFDRLLISVHPRGCHSAQSFVQRFVADARLQVDAASARSRTPTQPIDLVLRMVNQMVDSYLELRRDLTSELEHWQARLLRTHDHGLDWGVLMGARGRLQLLQDLCEEQHDAMQEWLDALAEQPLASFGADARQAQHLRDQLVARARDVVEHIERVAQHARRLDHNVENAVQMHFSAQSQRTNEIMRTLTAVTAVFLPLNLITGFFGMNFEFMPLIHEARGLWLAIGLMAALAVGLVAYFLRKRYIARTRK